METVCYAAKCADQKLKVDETLKKDYESAEQVARVRSCETVLMDTWLHEKDEKGPWH